MASQVSATSFLHGFQSAGDVPVDRLTRPDGEDLDPHRDAVDDAQPADPSASPSLKLKVKVLAAFRIRTDRVEGCPHTSLRLRRQVSEKLLRSGVEI